MPKVSVLLPTYKTEEEWLKESIQSILDQSFQDFELIILDDGSEKSPEDIVKSFNDNRIKFYQNEINLGVGKTRNKLLELATGDYVAFQDSDDISLPSRLEKQVDFLDKNLEFSGVSGWMETFPHKKTLKSPEEPKILDFLSGCKFTQGCAMLRLKHFREFDLKYNTRLTTSEDYDLWARSVEKLKLYNLQEILLKYRRNPQSLVHTQNNKIKEADIIIKQRILDKLTSDTKLQKKVIKLVSSLDKKQSSFFEKIFSIRNEWDGLDKNKIIQILGIKLKIKG